MAEGKKLRLWPIWVLLILDLAMVLWIWRGEIDERQSRLMSTIGIQLVVAFLAGIHLLFFARLSKKLRLRLVMAGIALFVALLLTVEIREVSGDVVPMLSWKWSKPPEERLANTDQSGTADMSNASEKRYYPRFLGPDGNGMLPGPTLASDWEAQPPTEVWRIEIGSGWSGFAIVGNLALTQEQRGEKEMVTCYNLQDGSLIWAQGLEDRFESTIAGNGPRSTPTVDGDKVYVMGANGHLSCRALSNGNLIWSHDTAADFGAQKPEWGFSGSPLVVGDTVYINGGGNGGKLLLAFDKVSGGLQWQAGEDRAGYGSPQFRTVAGFEAIILFNKNSFSIHKAGDGQELLSVPWGKRAPHVANPLLLPGDRLVVSSGYGVGSALFQLNANGDQIQATQVWKNLRLKAKFANFVFYGDHLYGLDDGILACVAIADGKRVWKGGRYGHGQVLLVGNKLLVQSEKGSLHLVEATPEARTELGTIQVLDGKAWNTMALANDLLLMRNHKEAVSLKLPVITSAASLD